MHQHGNDEKLKALSCFHEAVQLRTSAIDWVGEISLGHQKEACVSR